MMNTYTDFVSRADSHECGRFLFPATPDPPPTATPVLLRPRHYSTGGTLRSSCTYGNQLWTNFAAA
jgi:hypothetical protein